MKKTKWIVIAVAAVVLIAAAVVAVVMLTAKPAWIAPIEAAIDETFYDDKDPWKERFGKDFEVTYEISNEKKVDEAQLKKIAKALEEEGIDASDVKKGYQFDVEYIIKGSKGTDSSEWEDMYSILIDDRWYLVEEYGESIKRYGFCTDAW